MMLLEGLQRPVPVQRSAPEAILLAKTIRLANMLINKNEFVLFKGNSMLKLRSAYLCSLFMLIRAGKLSLVGSVIEKLVTTLELLANLKNPLKFLNGTNFGLLERGKVLKLLLIWRLRAKGMSGAKVLKQPLDSFVSLLAKRSDNSALCAKNVEHQDYSQPTNSRVGPINQSYAGPMKLDTLEDKGKELKLIELERYCLILF